MPPTGTRFGSISSRRRLECWPAQSYFCELAGVSLPIVQKCTTPMTNAVSSTTDEWTQGGWACAICDASGSANRRLRIPDTQPREVVQGPADFASILHARQALER